MPKISDPRLNTAQIVVKGHEGDKDQPIDYPKDYIDRAKWWMLLVSSILVTVCGGWYMFRYLHGDNCEKVIKFTIFGCSLLGFISFFIFSIVTFIKLFSESTETKGIAIGITHFIINLLVFVLSVIGICQYKKWELLWEIGVIPSWYNISYHSLWVLCGGISSEPTWAVPLFLIECFSAFILIYAIFLFSKQLSTENPGNIPLLFLHLFLGVLAVFATVAAIILALIYHVGLPTQNIVEVIMVAVLVWLVKKSRIFSEGK